MHIYKNLWPHDCVCLRAYLSICMGVYSHRWIPDEHWPRSWQEWYFRHLKLNSDWTLSVTAHRSSKFHVREVALSLPSSGKSTAGVPLSSRCMTVLLLSYWRPVRRQQRGGEREGDVVLSTSTVCRRAVCRKIHWYACVQQDLAIGPCHYR